MSFVDNPSASAVPILTVFDNVFPSRLSGFRLSEYTYLLESVPTAEVWCSGEVIGFAGTGSSIDEELGAFRESHPHLAERVRHQAEAMADAGERVQRVAYTIFLRQAYDLLPYFEAQGIPFAFTLYPGGGFRLEHHDSDFQLREVCSSPWFRKVIVTQPVTMDYLTRKEMCPVQKIALIPGCVAIDRGELSLPPRRVFGKDKPTIDLCFAAHRYEPTGRSKGYGTFLDIARLLSPRFPHVQFHVVGGFTADDLPVEDLAGRIQFAGVMPIDEMATFFTRMDAVISPNVPFELETGIFDGFPTGCCSEAALSGAAVFCSDPLNQNESFVPGEHLEIIPPHAPSAAFLIGSWLDQPDRLRQLASAGQHAFTEYYSIQSQLEPRLRVLTDCLVESVSFDRGLTACN